MTARVFAKVDPRPFVFACQIKTAPPYSPLERSLSSSAQWREVTGSARWPQAPGHYYRERVTDTEWCKRGRP